ncbi:reverse transcriptase [Pleurostoma richardsiae]|uniref:Reverse transcriptase n=1 Tax=Pleurostoma richardsiae TaxID=41990 RepID=A0AA38RKV5_9PEZI|nr:reverse transcriptase [Pleurostoma richardsiae]
MKHLLARKEFFNLSRTWSNATSTAASDQRSREEKSAPYRDLWYPLLLQIKGSYMDISELGITDMSNDLVQKLLDGEQPVPKETLFDEDLFVDACRNLENKNEARIVQDISRLIVPSAESLALRANRRRQLIESVDEVWSNSIPLTGTRPQPDYSVGFRREAFTDDQLAKLSPFIGDFIAGDQSFFMATYYMYFPLLTCEAKGSAEALDIADRQNAHSMTLAVRAVVELFRLAGRGREIDRQILAFSISHDHRSVRIYGHYPVMDGRDTKYHRHPIHEFSFTTLNGRDKWTAYRFTKNVYDEWMPAHFEKICSAIDQLPSN